LKSKPTLEKYSSVKKSRKILKIYWKAGHQKHYDKLVSRGWDVEAHKETSQYQRHIDRYCQEKNTLWAVPLVKFALYKVSYDYDGAQKIERYCLNISNNNS
jgi:hypothetical protein